MEARYSLKTFSTYATADFGVIGFESGGVEGYEIHAEWIVRICEPTSGVSLPEGERGEIVVSMR